MKVNLISITPDAEKLMAYCARVSSSNQENPDIKKLLEYCWKNKHWSVFEQADMTLEIITSRAIGRQILRHRSMKFQEFSLRYAEFIDFESIEPRRQDLKNRQNSIDDLSPEIKEIFQARQRAIERMASDAYKELISLGVAKESARFLLPETVQTKMYMKGDIRSWIHYIQVRTEPGVQKEHRDIALKARHILTENLPVLGRLIELA